MLARSKPWVLLLILNFRYLWINLISLILFVIKKVMFSALNDLDLLEAQALKFLIISASCKMKQYNVVRVQALEQHKYLIIIIKARPSVLRNIIADLRTLRWFWILTKICQRWVFSRPSRSKRYRLLCINSKVLLWKHYVWFLFLFLNGQIRTRQFFKKCHSNKSQKKRGKVVWKITSPEKLLLSWT